MTFLLTACLILHLVKAAWAAPTASFPFNAQLPLAARLGQSYTYSFSPNTFRSTSNITYTLGQHPSWLSIDSDGRRLHGTPQDSNVGPGGVVGQLFDIIATDDAGSTSMSSTIVVSRNKPPSVQVPLVDQIESFGHFSAPSSILSYPSKSFKYSFDPNTFAVGQHLNYYATSNDSTPLPAWVKFDASSLTFSGMTPAVESLVQPPERFEFSLVASDIVGFSGTSLSFAIVVGIHKLTTNNSIISLNATRGSKLSYDGLENNIQLDDKPVPPGSLNVSTDGMPSWLTYSSQTRVLTGTPEDGDHSTNFTINFHDPFADTLSVLVEVQVASRLFRSTLDDIHLRPGENFTLDLTSNLQDPGDVDIKIDANPQQDWLQVDGVQMFGKVPQTAKGQFSLQIEATSKSTGLTETESVHALFLPSDTTGTATSPSSTATTEPTTTSSTANAHQDRLSTGDILLATIIPILVVVLIVLLCVCIIRRRRQRQNYLSGKRRAKISSPVPSSLIVNGSEYYVGERAGLGKPEMQVHKGARSVSAEVSSPIATPPRKPATPGSGYVVEQASGTKSSTIRDATAPSEAGDSEESGRDSWLTVEDTSTVGKSDKSSRSPISRTSVAQPSLPTENFLTPAEDGTFRGGLDLTLPSLDDLSSMASMPSKPLAKKKSVGAYSTTTSSSAALPSSFSFSQEMPAMSFVTTKAGESSRDSNWEKLAESEAGESISELRRPDRARLSSYQTLTRRGSTWYDRDSITDRKSIQTEPSFGPSENWRVIGSRDPSMVYQTLVDEAPFNPSRPGTAREGSQPGERFSAELISPSQWGEDEKKSTVRPRSSTSIVSKVGNDNNSIFGEREARGKATAASWKREGSSKISEASSFQAFI